MVGGTPDAIDTGWTDNLDGTFSADGTQIGTVGVRWNSVAVVGVPYQIVFEVTSISAGVAYGAVGGTNTADVSTVSAITDVLSTTGDTNNKIRSSLDFVGTVKISIKQVTNVLNYRNIASDVRDTYTLTDGDWLGDELVSAAINVGSDWTDNLDGSYTVNSAAGAFNTLSFTSGIPVYTYKVSGFASIATGVGAIGIYGGASTIFVGGEGGNFDFSQLSSWGDYPLFSPQGGAITQTIDNVSVKRLIEVA